MVGGGQEECTSRACSHICYIVYKKNSSSCKSDPLSLALLPIFHKISWESHITTCVVVLSYPTPIAFQRTILQTLHTMLPTVSPMFPHQRRHFRFPIHCSFLLEINMFQRFFDDDNCRTTPTSLAYSVFSKVEALPRCLSIQVF